MSGGVGGPFLALPSTAVSYPVHATIQGPVTFCGPIECYLLQRCPFLNGFCGPLGSLPIFMQGWGTNTATLGTQYGDVRVLAWTPTSVGPPSYESPWISLEANTATAFQEVVHGLGMWSCFACESQGQGAAFSCSLLPPSPSLPLLPPSPRPAPRFCPCLRLLASPVTSALASRVCVVITIGVSIVVQVACLSTSTWYPGCLVVPTQASCLTVWACASLR